MWWAVVIGLIGRDRDSITYVSSSLTVVDMCNRKALQLQTFQRAIALTPVATPGDNQDSVHPSVTHRRVGVLKARVLRFYREYST